MGTRSLTVFQDDDGTEIVVMYRQMDGYPLGHGRDLAEFLRDIIIVNGYTLEDLRSKVANGMGCLAAQAVGFFKSEVNDNLKGKSFGGKPYENPAPAGGIYLYPAKTRDVGEEYLYTVCKNGNKVAMRVEVPVRVGSQGKDMEYETVFDGLASDFDPAVAQGRAEDIMEDDD